MLFLTVIKMNNGRQIHDDYHHFTYYPKLKLRQPIIVQVFKDNSH